MKLGDDIFTPVGGLLDAEIELFVLEASLFYHFPLNWGRVEAYAGARYWNIGIGLELTGSLTTIAASRCEERFDSVVGGRNMWDATEPWSFGMRADFGGFGVSSDFLWNILATVNWNATDWCMRSLGYRALGVDYDIEESSADFFSYDTIRHRPLLGIVFKF
jgi:hypothetical protein